MSTTRCTGEVSQLGRATRFKPGAEVLLVSRLEDATESLCHESCSASTIPKIKLAMDPRPTPLPTPPPSPQPVPQPAPQPGPQPGPQPAPQPAPQPPQSVQTASEISFDEDLSSQSGSIGQDAEAQTRLGPNPPPPSSTSTPITNPSQILTAKSAVASAAKELRLIRKVLEPKEAGEASSSRAVPPEFHGGSSSSGSSSYGDPSALWREFDNLEIHATRGAGMEVGVLKDLLEQLEALLNDARNQLIELEVQKALLEMLLAISKYRGEVEDSSSKEG
ncbi:hypothetical protein AlacWU_04048 [Aspergillus niger]|nr:hypothetical protein AlacWU_04048 [Aspergillus niger]